MTVNTFISPDLIIGDDGLARPPWAAHSEQLRRYYDTEWGLPIDDEQGLFERLSLEGFQAGLSWSLVLRKRPQLREAFADFDPDKVALFGEDEITNMLTNPDLIRNKLKLRAVINNARATQELREHGGLADFLWSFKPTETPKPRTMAEVPSTSPESAAMAAALKKAGFKFVGPTTCFALMEAVGMVDTHLLGSHRRGSSGIWSD